MHTAKQIAKSLREVHFGGNWTSVNLKAVLTDVTMPQALAKVHSFNTIATLVFHIHYYIAAVQKVLQGDSLNAKDEYSFAHPPITSEEDWQAMLDKMWSDADAFASLIEQLPDDQLDTSFTDEKYGTYYRNLQGIVEHTHYHLGQIVILKRLVQQS